MFRLFGDKLRYLRIQHTLSQAELARRLNAKRAHINNLEAGRRTPSLELVLAAAELFAVSTDYLLRDTTPIDTPIPAPDIQSSLGETAKALFGEKILYLRVKNNLTQIDLARRLDITSRGYVSNLETGRKAPSPTLVPQIADAFGVTTDYLLRDTIPTTLPE